MELALPSLTPGEPPAPKTKRRGSTNPPPLGAFTGCLNHMGTTKLLRLPKASEGSPRSAAELAALAEEGGGAALPGCGNPSPLVKHIARAPVAAPLTPMPAAPPKSTAVPAALYVPRLTFTPPRLVELGMKVFPGALVSGKYNRFTCC